MDGLASFRICVDHPPGGGPSQQTEGAAMLRVSRRRVIHLGLDLHKDSISVVVLSPIETQQPRRDAPQMDRILTMTPRSVLASPTGESSRCEPSPCPRRCVMGAASPGGSQFKGFCVLITSEHSSAGSTRRGHITKSWKHHVRSQP